MFNKRSVKLLSVLAVIAIFAGTIFAFALFSNVQGSLESYTFPAINGQEAYTAPAMAEMIGFTLRPGEELPFHYHDAPSFGVVTRGTLTEDDGCGNVVERRTGSAFTEEPGHVHMVSNRGPGSVTVYFSDIYPAGSSDAIFVEGPQCDGAK